MNNNAPAVLVLGGTGRTGSLLAGKLTRRGIEAGRSSPAAAPFPGDDFKKVTGRRPATFREFAERNAHAWTLEGK